MAADKKVGSKKTGAAGAKPVDKRPRLSRREIDDMKEDLYDAFPEFEEPDRADILQTLVDEYCVNCGRELEEKDDACPRCASDPDQSGDPLQDGDDDDDDDPSDDESPEEGEDGDDDEDEAGDGGEDGDGPPE